MIEAFFDCSSPWTYLAFRNLQQMAAEQQVAVRWRPILVGGVFNKVNPSVYAMRDNPIPAKWAYMLKDMQDWARRSGLTIHFPPRIFPINSVKAMRACLWLEPLGRMAPFAAAVFEAYWSRQEDIASDAVLAALAQQVGADPQALLHGIAQPDVKTQLMANTDELIARGGFGSPTFFIGDDMYFGNDRLGLLMEAAQRLQTRAAAVPRPFPAA